MVPPLVPLSLVGCHGRVSAEMSPGSLGSHLGLTSSDDKITSRAALLSAVPTLTLETLNGASKRQDRDGPQTPGSPIEDSPCPTCSSSSESEPEGFFFGQRLPEPWKTPENLQADDRDISRKHCTIC